MIRFDHILKNGEEVVLSKEEYEILLDKAKLLYCLEASCVTEWQGWAEAKKLYKIAYPNILNLGDFIFVPILEKVFDEMPKAKDMEGFINLFTIKNGDKDFYEYSNLKWIYDNYNNIYDDNYKCIKKPLWYPNSDGTIFLELTFESYWNVFIDINLIDKNAELHYWNFIDNQDGILVLDLKEDWGVLNSILNKLNNDKTYM